MYIHNVTHLGKLLLCMALSYFLIAIERSSSVLVAYEVPPYGMLSNVNLMFHELGHVLLTPLGQTAHIMGGSLLQWGIPLALAFACIVKAEWTAASVMTFWFGQSLHDEVPYIADANSLNIDLFAGSIHDWNYLLFQWGVLQHDTVIAAWVERTGIAIMFMATLACWILFLHGLFRAYQSKHAHQNETADV